MHGGVRIKRFLLLDVRREASAIMRTELLHVILISTITFRATKHIFLNR